MFSLLADTLPGMRYFTADEALSPYVFVFYAAYIIALCFTPVLRRIATYYGIIDQPDSIRKLHSYPVAYLGGVAVFLGWLGGLAISQYTQMHRSDDPGQSSVMINFSIVVGGCAIVMLGLWDDVLHVKPWMKIGGQVFAALILLAFDIGRHSAWVFMAPILTRTSLFFGWPAPGSGIDALYDHWLVLAASVVFVIVVVVGCCNATNLMDGLDGLCGGVTAVVSAGFLFLAVNLAMRSGAVNANEDGLRVVLGLALLGGVLGFVPFNFNPASIFMGDTGSMFLGYACAVMMVLFANGGHFKWLLASVVMFSLPLLDTALAIVRRIVNKRPLFSPDRYHFHHQLIARGFTVKQTVIISYGLSLVFCVLGAAIVYIRARYAVAVYLVVFGSVVVAAYKMGLVHERVKVDKAQPLSSGGGAAVSAELEPGTVLELQPAAAESSVSVARRNAPT